MAEIVPNQKESSEIVPKPKESDVLMLKGDVIKMSYGFPIVMNNIYKAIKHRPDLDNYPEAKEYWDVVEDKMCQALESCQSYCKKLDYFYRISEKGEQQLNGYCSALKVCPNSPDGLEKTMEIQKTHMQMVKDEFDKLAKAVQTTVKVAFEGSIENFKKMVSKQSEGSINGLLTKIQEEEEKLKKWVQEYEEIRRFPEIQPVLDNKSKLEGEIERYLVLDEHLEKQIEMVKSELESVNRSLSESKKISENDVQASMTFMKNQGTQLEEERKNLEELKKKELQKLYDDKETNNGKHQEKLRKYADDLDTAVQKTTTTTHDHDYYHPYYYNYWWYDRPWWRGYATTTTTTTDQTSGIKDKINHENQSITTENQSYDSRCKSTNQTYDERLEHVQKKLKMTQDFSNASLAERQKNSSKLYCRVNNTESSS